MATLLKRLLTGIKQFLANLEERLFLTTTQPSATGLHPTSRSRYPRAHARGTLAEVICFSSGIHPRAHARGPLRTVDGAAHNGRRNGSTATVPQDTATLSQSSHAERAAAWADHAHLSPEEQLREWERYVDSRLAGLSADQRAFLKRLLRQNGQMVDTVVVSATAIYHVFMEEGRGDIEFFARRIVETNSPAQLEQNKELIEGLAKMYGDQSATRVLPLLSALRNTQDHHRFSLCIGTDIRTGQEVGMTPKALEQHVSLVGNSGTGKTTLCLQMLNQLFRLGHGGALVEPHGDLTRQVIACLPEESLERVVYLDLSDGQSHFGLNLYQCDAPHDMIKVAKVASFVMHVFEKVWNVGTETPRLQQVLRNITRTLLENPGMTFAEIPLLLWDETVREKLVTSVKNTQTQLFWQQYNKKSVRDREELIASTINKVDAYLAEPLVANIVSQSQTTLDFRHIMDEGKILLVNLSPQLEEMSRLIGAMLVGKLLMAAFSRADTPEQDRRPFYIFIDEFQRFCSSEFRTFIEEARKFHVSVITAHQSLTQLEEEHRTASTGAGSLMCFRVLGDPDAKVFARSFDATPQPVEVGLEPERAVAADPLSHLVSRGHQDPRVARFAQTVLHNLEYFLKTPSSPSVAYVKSWHASYNCFDRSLTLSDWQVQEGRKLLNQCLYTAMSEANPNLYIPMLAIYILSAAQRDGREYVFSPHIKHY